MGQYRIRCRPFDIVGHSVNIGDIPEELSCQRSGKQTMPASSIIVLLVNGLIVQTAPSGPTALGSVHAMDDQCLQYSSCGTKGRQYWKTLMDTLASLRARDKDGDFDILETRYLPKRVDLDGAGQEDLIAHSLLPIDEYHRWHLSAREDDGVEDEEAPT